MTEKVANSVPVIRDVYELKLGPVLVMLVDEHPEYGIRSPLAFGGTGTTIHLHVDDVDTLTARAREAGATVLREAADYGHGERQSREQRERVGS